MPWSPLSWTSRGGAQRRQRAEGIRSAALKLIEPAMRAAAQRLEQDAGQTHSLLQSASRRFGAGIGAARRAGENAGAENLRRIAESFAPRDVGERQAAVFRGGRPGRRGAPG